jgi:putative ABC transport system permease protein
MIPLSYNVRSLTTRKTTTIAAVLGIGLVVFVFSAALMLMNGIENVVGQSGRSDNVIILRKGSDAELASAIDEKNVGLILAKDAIARKTTSEPMGLGEVVAVVTLDKAGTDGVSNVLVRGTTPFVWEFRPEARLIEGRKATPGTDEVVIGKAIRGRFRGVDLGQTFELKKNRPVTVVGIFEAAGSSSESEAWGDIDTVRSAFGRQGLVSSVRARLQAESKFAAFKTDVETDKNLGMAVEREDKFFEKQSSGLSMFLGMLGIIIAVFFSFGAMIGAAITMYGQVANRTKEVGTLRALGFSRFAILVSFLLESILLAIAGGVFGSFLSLGMSMVEFGFINFASWSEVILRFDLEPSILVSSLIFAVVMGVLGGLLPALRAAYISPIQAMRN